ncbi:MAG TPA: CDP-glycerol glycerophosphotransferase family protein [Ramlibacter sp.]|uniref:CDP-glycerol glycerophosphotransferase family protein n=1 Tax=Ramlibacter sp. TaxID=1917967 RepID=UPI002D802366|nr:CDP-glycerol glycerophosphotransferase family protein [Ramlibacter sp.]HET8744038.1 CDP-glycerol glycerophosphotransferase family protein [Ramlibacter sp.]
MAISDRLPPSMTFAFVVHEPMMLDHYAGVWRALGRSRFAIVLTEHFHLDDKGAEKEGVAAFLQHVEREGYELLDVKDVIRRGIAFPNVVTNHVISGWTAARKPVSPEDEAKKRRNGRLAAVGRPHQWDFEVDIDTYLPLQIGRRQIRYMYGADLSDAWSLQPWNEIYDIFLCHGVNDQKIVSQRFAGTTFIMGYPRYDEYFRPDLDTSAVRQEFGLVQGRKTLLWMPTLGGTGSSIPLFAQSLAALRGEFNLVVRPHPLSFVQEPQFIEELDRLGFAVDRNATRNMNQLFKAADLVLADYGGTPFSAIFIGKPLVFLDVPGGDELPMNAGSTVLELKRRLPVIAPGEVDRLASMLRAESFWAEIGRSVDALFDTYFGGTRGGGAARVADYFERIDEATGAHSREAET